MESWSADDLNALTRRIEYAKEQSGWRFRAYKTPEGWKYEYPPV